MLNISKIYRTFQGEGKNIGTEVVVVRLHGCNLSCPFCDEQESESMRIRVSDLIDRIFCVQLPSIAPVLLTGGEPSLQITTSELMDLKSCGLKIFMETNGTSPTPGQQFKEGFIDWLTVSPKSTKKWDLMIGSELKVLERCFTEERSTEYDKGEFCHKIVQPVWSDAPSERKKSLHRSMRIVSSSCGVWSLGIQAHKTWGLP